MKGIQKVIKYIAIALAMFIIINICGGILFGLSMIAAIFGLDEGEDIPESERITQLEDIKQIKKLDIEIKFAKLSIKHGDMFKVEANDKNIYCNKSGDSIQIRDKNNSLRSKNKEVIIYIPDDFVFEDVNIIAGAGKVDVEFLLAKNLSFDIGAGSAVVKELTVLEKAKINGGAGNFEIRSGSMNNLELNVGAGKTEVESEILGNSKIEAGIGKLDLHLIGDDYRIETENGIGVVKINGDTVTRESKYGDGNNLLKVEGGIGSIDINFKNR